MTQTPDRPTQAVSSDFEFFETITLRYADNDGHGHVNNAHYYSFFDTAVEGYLRAKGMRDVLSGSISTPVVASSCRYFEEVAFPGTISVGVRVERIGQTSITYLVAIFVNEEQLARAQGTFTTVATSRDTGRPVEVPQAFRQAHGL
ncbi:MAG: acyl-CoA thioesterase [Burkholderiaceae bacterium]|nr:acyl-CoA thioesterase [Burkholderiaceae bacterium]MCD8516534.1 acyl-CoA thioesterase [Burkholderiaceae bacterium]MCD8536200.1 acyl-CoA thioesterase [Burkholderiaceae bacterium]MCD8564832.1 acyl-CoA thioesterase [Burkholderiaceae bacterium]